MKHEHGMTLIEALVWIAVFTSAMLALTSSVLYFYRTSNYAIEQSSALASAQQGIDLTVRTLREASYSSNGGYPILAIATSSVTFYADVDSDTAIEQVHYYMQGNTLMKGILNPSGSPLTYSGSETTSVVSTNLRNASQSTAVFTYYDKNGAQISNYTRVADVRFVSVTILVDVDPNRTPTPVTLRSSAALRNLIGS